MTITEKISSCKDCDRTHTEDMPCPRRIAQALATAHPDSLKALTVADSLYIKDDDGTGIPSIQKILEEWITEDLGMNGF